LVGKQHPRNTSSPWKKSLILLSPLFFSDTGATVTSKQVLFLCRSIDDQKLINLADVFNFFQEILSSCLTFCDYEPVSVVE
jgi:hypothetical protein